MCVCVCVSVCVCVWEREREREREIRNGSITQTVRMRVTVVCCLWLKELRMFNCSKKHKIKEGREGRSIKRPCLYYNYVYTFTQMARSISTWSANIGVQVLHTYISVYHVQRSMDKIWNINYWARLVCVFTCSFLPILSMLSFLSLLHVPTLTTIRPHKKS